MAVAEPAKPHIVVLPSPGMGHVIPLFEFATRLVTHHACQVTFLLITTTEDSAAAANNHHIPRSPLTPSALHVVHLPPADMSNIPTDTPILTRLSLITDQSLRYLRPTLAGTTRPDALVIDLFCTQAFSICDDLSIPVYSFLTASAALLTFALYLPTLDSEVEGEFVDLPDPVQIPGCRPIRTEDLLDQVRNRKIDEYKWIMLHFSRLPQASGIFANTWRELEPVPFNALRENPFFRNLPTPPVHEIGPVIKLDEPVTESDKEVENWLDKQPNESVIFVCFGSGGTLTSDQLTELALGLELSQQRFILVAREPTDARASAAFFDGGRKGDDPAVYLPEGFVERVKGVGLVVASWAPQVVVLRHGATAAFVSHCGWNSTLESVAHGVPMVAWPLYAEQRMNAAALAEEVGVAVRPAAGERVVGREEVERVVRLVMEGEEGKVMRRRARELRESARKALDFGGSSWSSLSSVVEGWKSKHNTRN
ncbi:anthocyanidin 3-O-glucosyltransferase 5-like [Actinidia eriantha]|uniref:anthocyanidin 3-O-glucosyltransferase 5-like n=1 Tax=Actinidia eriantha TaxID=165200 RepID=UPI00258C761D|nr:anthocyanidin 3-O-glucosyltransferase 5-like [Actinidia eriantha]